MDKIATRYVFILVFFCLSEAAYGQCLEPRQHDNLQNHPGATKGNQVACVDLEAHFETLMVLSSDQWLLVLTVYENVYFQPKSIPAIIRKLISTVEVGAKQSSFLVRINLDKRHVKN